MVGDDPAVAGQAQQAASRGAGAYTVQGVGEVGEAVGHWLRCANLDVSPVRSRLPLASTDHIDRAAHIRLAQAAWLSD